MNTFSLYTPLLLIVCILLGVAHADSLRSEQGERNLQGDSDIAELSFDCTLDITFFPGKGREPNEQEIHELKKEVIAWFDAIFGTHDAFKDFEYDNGVSEYDIVLEPDHFTKTFSSYVELEKVKEVDDNMKMSDIADLLNNANYETFITDFIWATGEDNEFWQTHHVELWCTPKHDDME